jgi:hypothetical protein
VEYKEENVFFFFQNVAKEKEESRGEEKGGTLETPTSGIISHASYSLASMSTMGFLVVSCTTLNPKLCEWGEGSAWDVWIEECLA